MSRLRLAIAIVLLLVGLVWIGQGTGLVGGSGMSGQSIWALIGVVLVIAAAWLAWTARRTAPGLARRWHSRTWSHSGRASRR